MGTAVPVKEKSKKYKRTQRPNIPRGKRERVRIMAKTKRNESPNEDPISEPVISSREKKKRNHRRKRKRVRRKPKTTHNEALTEASEPTILGREKKTRNHKRSGSMPS